MATFEADDAERLLKKFRTRRADIVERLATGAVSADNVASGYREMTGWINALDQCIEDVKEIFGS